MKIDSKVSVVTGAGTGMGRSLAIQLAREGSSIAICDINPNTLKDTVELAEKTKKNDSVKITSYIVDVSDEQAVKEFRDQVLTDHDGKVHIIINNAGIQADGRLIHPNGTTKEDIEAMEKGWDRCFRINFYGVVYCTRAFLDVIIAQEEGCIANTSSVNAFFTWPEHSCYTASKHAVDGFTKSLLTEMMMKHPHINVCCIHPGGVKTELLNNATYIVNNENNRKMMNSRFMDMCDLTPDEAADWILHGIKNNKTRILVGYDAIGFDAMMRVSTRGPYALYQTLGELGIKSIHPDNIQEAEEKIKTPKDVMKVILGGGWWYAVFIGWTGPMRLRRYPIILGSLLVAFIAIILFILVSIR